MQTVDFVPSGLEFQSYRGILCKIKTIGFNTVRIPISDQLVKDNAHITIANDVNFEINPELAGGLHPLAVLDKIVAAAQEIGLMIILDNHFSGARQCPAGSPCPGNVDRSTAPRPTGNTYPWLDSGYTQRQWIQDWVTLADRYAPGHQCGSTACGVEATVIGFDLRNEPHTDYGHHSWTLADYLTRGATWGPYPNSQRPDPQWNPKSDWAAAATAAGNAVLAVNPHLLMFVEGVQLWPDPLQPGGVEVYARGGILRGVHINPVQFTEGGRPLLHQLVYSAHEWGPIKNNLLGEFSYKTTFQTMNAIFLQNWAFILHESSQLQVPIWLGEFNSCNTGLDCISSTKHGSQGQWFQIMLQFLRENPEVGWSYYPVNGTNWLNQREINGILKRDWASVKMAALVNALYTVERRSPLTITAGDASATYGQSIPAIMPKYAGLKYGQTALLRPPVCSTTATVGADAGTYATSCSRAGDPGYDITYVSGKLQISPADSAITLSADPNAKRSTYGQTVTLAARITSSAGSPDGSVALMDSGTRAGLAPIVQGASSLSTTSLRAGAHTLTTVFIPAVHSQGLSNFVPSESLPVRHVVQRAHLTISPLKRGAVFGHALPHLTWAANFVNGDTATSMARQPKCRANVKIDVRKRIASAAGTYTISCEGAVNRNYRISYVTATLTVKTAPTRLTYAGPKSLKQGKKIRLSAIMKDESGAAISGRNLLLTIVKSGHKQWCRAGKTDEKGMSHCTIRALTLAAGKASVVIQFAGDIGAGARYYAKGSRRANVLITR
jgi:aryl-phospho-beta-D-glucosidase BglC (GH1 family)